MTVVFRSSKERIETAALMQKGWEHPLAQEYCFLDAEHDKVLGMKTINLSIQYPTLKEMVTLASMDCTTESTETLSEFWRQLNEVRDKKHRASMANSWIYTVDYCTYFRTITY